MVVAVHGYLSISSMVSMVIVHNHISCCVYINALTNYLLYAMYIAKGDKHAYTIGDVSFNLLFALKEVQKWDSLFRYESAYPFYNSPQNWKL